MDKAEAKAFVHDLATKAANFTQFEGRTVTLIDRPDELYQGSFGICGMSSMVRTLLRQRDLGRFAELLDAIFRDQSFNGIAVGPGELLDGRLKQWQEKEDHRTAKGGNVPQAQHKIDFVLARSLGKLLKLKAPKIYEVQLMASEEMVRLYRTRPDSSELTVFTLDAELADDFDKADSDPLALEVLRYAEWRVLSLCGFGLPKGGTTIEQDKPGSSWWVVVQDGASTRRIKVTRDGGQLVGTFDAYAATGAYQKQGDLGLDDVGIETLMRRVLGAASCSFTEAERDPLAAISTVNAEFRGSTPFVYAFVNGTPGWSFAKNVDPVAAFVKAADPAVKYFGKPKPIGRHLVVIDGEIQDAGSDVLVPTWTWGKSFTARIPKANLAGYLAGYSHGQL